MVSHSPLACSVTVTVRVTDSDDEEETCTNVVSRVDENPLQSSPCWVLSDTAASSSPEFWTIIVYYAASSAVASAELGFAERLMSTSAETIVADMLSNITTVRKVSDFLVTIAFRTVPTL